MHYHFKIHNDPDGLWAECVEIKDCMTQSENDTMGDLLEKMHEVLNLFLDESESSRMLFPYPKEKISGKGIVKVKVEPEIAFAMLVRQYRIEHEMSQPQMAEKLGYKNISAYQKLEKKGNPKLSTISYIKMMLPDIPFEKYLFA